MKQTQQKISPAVRDRAYAELDRVYGIESPSNPEGLSDQDLLLLAGFSRLRESGLVNILQENLRKRTVTLENGTKAEVFLGVDYKAEFPPTLQGMKLRNYVDGSGKRNCAGKKVPSEFREGLGTVMEMPTSSFIPCLRIDSLVSLSVRYKINNGREYWMSLKPSTPLELIK